MCKFNNIITMLYMKMPNAGCSILEFLITTYLVKATPG